MSQRKYSVAICPPKDVVEIFRLKKTELKALTGKFSSDNSEAHITINLFHADDKQLDLWRKSISRFCMTRKPFEVALVKAGNFMGSEAFYIGPDKESGKQLVALMKDFHKHATPPVEVKITNPHMTIGKNLSPSQMAKAKELWGKENFDIRFICEGLHIRKFNAKRGQYDVLEPFPFEGKEIQLSLF